MIILPPQYYFSRFNILPYRFSSQDRPGELLLVYLMHLTSSKACFSAPNLQIVMTEGKKSIINENGNIHVKYLDREKINYRQNQTNMALMAIKD